MRINIKNTKNTKNTKIIYKDGKYNYRRPDGSYTSEVGFDAMYDYCQNFALVCLNNKGWNYIDLNGKYLTEIWYEHAYDFSEDGIANICISENKWAYLKTDGTYLTNTYFDYANIFSYGVGLVKQNNKYNFIDVNGNFISSIWFNRAGSLNYGWGMISIDNKYNFINCEGKLISPINFENESYFYKYTHKNGAIDYIADIFIDGKGWNFINTSGQLMLSVWCDEFRGQSKYIIIKNEFYTISNNFDIVYVSEE